MKTFYHSTLLHTHTYAYRGDLLHTPYTPMYQEDCAHNNILIKTVSDKNKKGNAGRKYEVCNGCKKFLRFRPSDESAPGWDDYQPPEWDDNHAPGWDDYWEGGNDFTSSETHELGPLRLSDLNTNNMDAAPSAQTVHHEALTKIINQFSATHVFIRHTGGINVPEAKVWEAVFQKNYPDCVTSVAELVEAKRTNCSLYESSKERYVDEMERLYHKLSREHDEKYPEKIYISYTPPTAKLNWAERLSNIGGNSITANSATAPELAEQANLTYFNGNFYAKTPNGCPIEGISYILKDLNNVNSVSGSERPNVNEAIVTLANAILNT